MSWDWEKLKEQQQHQRPGSGGPGNIPPQVDDLVKQFKNMKIPGGPLIALVIVLILFTGYSVFFTIESGSVGVVQRFGNIYAQFRRIASTRPVSGEPIRVCHTAHEVADNVDALVMTSYFMDTHDVRMT